MTDSRITANLDPRITANLDRLDEHAAHLLSAGVSDEGWAFQQLPVLVAVLREVARLHAPSDSFPGSCDDCMQDWPCPTGRALAPLAESAGPKPESGDTFLGGPVTDYGRNP